MNANDNFKNLVASTATVCTILQFLTGTLVCIKISKNKTTGDISSLPFVSGCLTTSLWLRYGFLIKESSIILVNTIGASLFLAYVVTFLLYSLKKSTVIKQFGACLFFLIFVLFYVEKQANPVDAINTLGVICCCVAILFFAAPLASLVHVIKVKSTESLPFPIIMSNFVVSMQWFYYGVIIQDHFVQIPNFMGCMLSGFQLCLYLKYPRVSVKKEEFI